LGRTNFTFGKHVSGVYVRKGKHEILEDSCGVIRTGRRAGAGRRIRGGREKNGVGHET